MIRTISIGSTLQVQGTPVGTAPDGRLLVRVGKMVYAGQPVPKWTDLAAACAPQRAETENLNVS
jgi:hypothetical protein